MDAHIFSATNIILSQQKFCRGKHTFVATKMILVAAPVKSYNNEFYKCHQRTKHKSQDSVTAFIDTPLCPLLQRFKELDFISRLSLSTPVPEVNVVTMN